MIKIDWPDGFGTPDGQPYQGIPVDGDAPPGFTPSIICVEHHDYLDECDAPDMRAKFISEGYCPMCRAPLSLKGVDASFRSCSCCHISFNVSTGTDVSIVVWDRTRIEFGLAAHSSIIRTS